MKTDKKTSSQMAADEATAADGLATQRHARAMRYTEQLLEQLVLEEHADRLAQQAETGDAETDLNPFTAARRRNTSLAGLSVSADTTRSLSSQSSNGR